MVYTEHSGNCSVHWPWEKVVKVAKKREKAGRWLEFRPLRRAAT